MALTDRLRSLLTRFSLTASPRQLFTYLLLHSLFSISFLVYLNSALSFLITQRLGLHHGVGDAIGTLGFVDELVALVACPVWGVVSDRLGVRNVAAVGFAVIGGGLWLVVACRDVSPGLVLARVVFAVGASATSTMVTAILPAMTYTAPPTKPWPQATSSNGHQRTPTLTPSISSELTITPTRLTGSSHSNLPSTTPSSGPGKEGSTSQLAGLVGTFTGLGALLALAVFLPLPTRFQKAGYSPAEAIAAAFWVVGGVAFLVSILVFIGLSGLPGEGDKGIHRLFHWSSTSDKGEEDGATSTLQASTLGTEASATATTTATSTVLAYPTLLYKAVQLGFTDPNIGLGYLGGLVARASSVGISLFIPFFVNHYFLSHGLCNTNPADPSAPDDLKHSCRRAYLVASALTGVSQLFALVCAPLFGYLASRPQYKNSNLPLLLAAAAGVAGNAAFARLKSPDFHDAGDGGVWAIVVLLGISQIGAIVCSLGLLGRGVQSSSASKAAPATQATDESAPLLGVTPSSSPLTTEDSRAAIKGSIAGVYSLSGGVGILLLTKLGGWAADRDPGAPFIMLAAFNGILLLAGIGVWIGRSIKS